MPPKEKQKSEPKQYFEQVPRRVVYAFLGLFAVVAALLFLCVPHYKPLQLASPDQTQDAHRAIIIKYFLKSTVCKDDTRGKVDRVKTFNQYFKTNKYGNRAVLRGCNDADVLLFKDDQGRWQRSDVKLALSSRLNTTWQKACLIDDITMADTKMPSLKSAIDATNLKICESLAKESYIEVNLKQGMQFHF